LLKDLVPRLDQALKHAIGALLAARNAQGYWEGQLSSSALSTATAATALAIAQRESQSSNFASQIESGLVWLAENANADGGWGDTTRSLSNLSTTTLCWAAFGAVPKAGDRFREVIVGAERWINHRTGGLQVEQLAPTIVARYGKDRTFSVPILTMCALAGRLGEKAAWRWVIQLPFELAALPPQWFAALRLPVVSYALPALIAMGQARHVYRPSPNPLMRWLRNAVRSRTLDLLARIQPSNGGFLEATPLTSFVTMSLAGSGQVDHPVTERGLDFLVNAQRADGSWPIDTNLATWVTTLAIEALGEEDQSKIQNSRAKVRQWLLSQQYREIHPYTNAAPGGWAWTDLPGGVPDADDTSGALIALRALGPVDGSLREAAVMGIRWLLGLQNRDGGIPTFCRGWGTLPFDRSSADITAHAIGAWLAWLDELPTLRDRILQALRRALRFLARTQRPEGAWHPLWFGNECAPEEANPTYGTARVLCALAAVAERKEGDSGLAVILCKSALAWLVRAQNADGGWGGASGVLSSTEETALAVEALATSSRFSTAETQGALASGAKWLVERVEAGAWEQPSPIGFYFAKLWYFERLYPLIFTARALRKAAELCKRG
jgi:squalene-hopene/tetraprenyl-beta-curcumene cyclase